MSVRPESIQFARAWIDKAENDLRTAEHTLIIEEDCPFDTICFHAQQCAEKYLKALLTIHETAFPRTHDLTLLQNLAPDSARQRLDLADLSLINRYSVEARYPGDWEPISRADAEEAVSIARQVRETVRQQMPQEVLG